MSTRCVTHFVEPIDLDDKRPKPVASIYRHFDGYPEGMKPDLLAFFEAVRRNTNDTRFMDAEYLAAKWVVFLARMFAQPSERMQRERGKEARPFDFTGVGIASAEASDIDYRYLVNCSHNSELYGSGYPLVAVQKRSQRTVHWEDPAHWGQPDEETISHVFKLL